MAERAPVRLRDEPLPGALAADFAAWLAKGRSRYVPPLTPRELHAGVRALSSLYVGARRLGPGGRVFDGLGKRAAFATYYAPLHFLVTHHALAAVWPEGPGELRQILDLGCGSAAAGAAAARATAKPPRILGLDASGWALGEARATLAAFGLRGRLRRGRIPGGLPGGARGELWLLGWVVNELGEGDRDALLARIEAALDAGARLLLLEPLAGSISPWWPAWRDALAPRGIEESELRVRVTLPPLLADVDRATGLRHGELGARLLHGPHP